MTRKTFYRKLRKVAPKFDWVVVNGRIRGNLKGDNNPRPKYCPINSIGYAEYFTNVPNWQYDISGKAMGLPKNDQEIIAESADNCRMDYKREKIRKALLRAVGLATL